jgi:hypothetical protein
MLSLFKNDHGQMRNALFFLATLIIPTCALAIEPKSGTVNSGKTERWFALGSF